MTILINEIIGSAVQIAAFALIPLIWWAVTSRGKQGFLPWIGLTKPVGGGRMWGCTAAAALAFVLSGALALWIVRGLETAASAFAGQGIAAMPAVLVYAIFHTALPEELVFRGFLLKRLAVRLGFTAANAVQAALFGLVHGAMFFAVAGPVKALAIIAFTGAVAACMGYINEKQAGGSILPSWAIHAASNVFSGIVTAFSLI